jgi:hypothetical protein
VISIPNYEDLPIITDRKSALWASRLVMAIVGESPEPTVDLDLVERMVQAIRNESAREICLEVEKKVALDCWREP